MSSDKESGKSLSRDALENVAEVFRVFGDATRLLLLQALKQGPRNVGQLVDELGTTQANISKHLRILYQAGLLTRERQGNSVLYAIDDDIVFPMCQLVCDKLNREAQAKPAASYDFAI